MRAVLVMLRYIIIHDSCFIYIFSIFQGVFAKSFKDSFVKKLLVLSALPDVPEDYSNLKQMLDQLDIEAIEFTVSADIKMSTYFIMVH